jgi:hypothetical protein
MMDFAALELAISIFLSSKINNPKVEVNPLPENDADFEKIFGKEVIIVAFSDEEPDMSQKALSMVLQDTEITFAFLIQSKSLRGAHDKLGVYALHRLIKKFIVGYEPTPGLAFRYSGFKMQDKVNDIFNYAVYFKTKGFVAQDTDNDDSEVITLQKVTFNQ